MSEMTEPLFPELVAELVAEIHGPTPNPCRFPLFILAYWPRGNYWAIKNPLAWNDDADGYAKAQRAVNDLHVRGWAHITVLRLPREGPWAQK